MRIISGRFGGRNIRAPKNLPVRPTTDMAKEGLFNILYNRLDIEDLNVLDLFCGTGNISYEFQSRGAQKTTSVDASFKCTAFVKKTMNELGCSNSEVIKSDVPRFLVNAYQKWDLIFADPPFDFPKYQELTQSILSEQLLEKDGILIMEHPAEVDLSEIGGYQETRKYGRVHFSFFFRRNNSLNTLKFPFTSLRGRRTRQSVTCRHEIATKFPKKKFLAMTLHSKPQKEILRQFHVFLRIIVAFLRPFNKKIPPFRFPGIR